jgi:hypothetical protein
MRFLFTYSEDIAYVTCLSKAYDLLLSVSLIIVFALEFVVWFVPNIIVEAVAVSFMGMFLVRFGAHIAPPNTLTNASMHSRDRYFRW